MRGEAARLDTLRHVETPEGISLSLRPAGLVPRCLAYAVDLLLRGMVLIAAAELLTSLRGFGFGGFMLLMFVVEWFYPVLFELAPGAATPGKRALGLQVLMADGLPVTPGASVLRNLLRAVDFLPMLYLAGGLTMLLRPDFRRLGDLVAGTQVVYRPLKPHPFDASPGLAVAPAQPLTVPQQAALLALADRQKQLTPERLDELAQPLAPWLQAPEPGDEARAGERLMRTARWLMGQR